MSEIITREFDLRDHFVPMDKLIRGQRTSKLARGILYREDKNCFGKTIFTKVGENTVVLGGAIAALEKLTNKKASFRPNTLNSIMNLNASGYTYDPLKTPIALFGCGIGGATLVFDEVFDPSVRQNTLAQMVPMMVSENALTGADASKYMMRTTISTPGGSTLNAWYLKEFDIDPTIRSLWKDAAEENQDGTEITADVASSESTNGVESFANFKLVLTEDDVRTYFEAIGQLNMARINTIGLFMGEKVTLANGRKDYVNVSLFSVLNLNNEPLAERKKIIYHYRVYAMI